MSIKSLVCSSALCMLTPLVFSAPQKIAFATPDTPVFADHGTVVLNLKANPTTGYFWRWVPQGNEANYVTQVSQKYIPFKQPNGFVGGGGYEQWVFNLSNKLTQVDSQITLHMMYGRIRMPVNTPAQAYTVVITPPTD